MMRLDLGLVLVWGALDFGKLEVFLVLDQDAAGKPLLEQIAFIYFIKTHRTPTL